MTSIETHRLAFVASSKCLHIVKLLMFLFVLAKLLPERHNLYGNSLDFKLKYMRKNQSNESGASSSSSLSRLKRGAAIITVGLLLMLACSSVTSWTSIFSPKFNFVHKFEPKNAIILYFDTVAAFFCNIVHATCIFDSAKEMYFCQNKQM